MTAELRAPWVRSLLAAAFPYSVLRPVYGSPEWLRLPERSLQRLASAAVAGECWARDGDELESRVFDEWWASRAEEDAYWAGVDATARRVVRAHGRVLPYAQRGIPRRVS